jgi:phage terminase small subunit
MAKQLATKREGLVINVVPSFTGKMPIRGIKLFLDQYIIDFNAAQAAIRSGHTAKWSESHGLKALKQHADYLDWKQRIHAAENATRISMDQEMIFAEMELIARANIQDYFTLEAIEVQVEVKKGEKARTKKTLARRWKHPEELTREQAAAVKRVVLRADGTVDDYILYDKDSNLFSLGRHLGMFSEKVILEHRHKHLHMKADFSKMPIEKLLELEQEFLPYLPESMKEAR